jgi:hypothetical protein
MSGNHWPGGCAAFCRDSKRDRANALSLGAVTYRSVPLAAALAVVFAALTFTGCPIGIVFALLALLLARELILLALRFAAFRLTGLTGALRILLTLLILPVGLRVTVWLVRLVGHSNVLSSSLGAVILLHHPNIDPCGLFP